jgi:uncharacterized Fe-S center protein
MIECYRRYAETCRAILDSFESAFFISDLRRITEFCDCSVDPGPIISSDIGLIADDNPIDIDTRSVDVISGTSPDAASIFGDKWGDFIQNVENSFK